MVGPTANRLQKQHLGQTTRRPAGREASRDDPGVVEDHHVAGSEQVGKVPDGPVVDPTVDVDEQPG
ncbi:uncharacterized protein METZ01_LOCUS132793 [marine metagenome]|uniref:Uncharacterized protein n=1 Tax=marine metagenome TaxID=408172 RepID=A0A381YSJ3_9ZZZZ